MNDHGYDSTDQHLLDMAKNLYVATIGLSHTEAAYALYFAALSLIHI